MILNAKDGEGKIRRNERLEATIYVLGRVNDKVWGCVGLVLVGGLWPDAYRELARVPLYCTKNAVFRRKTL